MNNDEEDEIATRERNKRNARIQITDVSPNYRNKAKRIDSVSVRCHQPLDLNISHSSRLDLIQIVNIVIGLIKTPYEKKKKKEKRIIYDFVFVLQLIELVD